MGWYYAKVDVSPEPLSVVPDAPEGKSTPSVRNPAEPVTYALTFPPNTFVTIGRNQFTGSSPGTNIVIETTDYTSNPLSGASVTALAREGVAWKVAVVTTGNGGGDDHPPENWISDPYVAPEPPPANGEFALIGPIGGQLLTDTRRPTFSWEPVADAQSYELYVNLSRTDYDWMAPGSLLDRYTHVATVTGATEYTFAEALPDRWTYKWYVVAQHSDGATEQSDVGVFSVYQPELTTVEDGVAIIEGCRDLNGSGTIEPYENWRNSPAVRTADLLGRMSREQKAMQLFFNTQEYPEAGFGFGPFSIGDLLQFQINASQTDLGIPNIVMGDTIHGYKTVFPTQPGLAATRDLDLAWKVADMQRRESLAVGNRGTLSPLAEVGTKVLYPRIQEGGGEDADLAAGMVRAMVVGLQGGPEISPDSMMITTKHWASQGAGGESGVVYDGTTIWYHMRPWHAAIEAGSSSIMPGYGGSWLLESEGWGAGDDPGILGFLRKEMGYDGLICTDWLPSGAWVRACTNGADVMGGANPGQMGDFANEVPLARLDDAVTRVLDLKFRLGLFEDPYGAGAAGTAQWHTSENVAIAREAAQKSLTLLKNDGPLPLRLASGTVIVVDGPRADDPSCMVTWRSDFHEGEFGSKTIYRAIRDRAAAAGMTVYGPSARDGLPLPAEVTPDAAIVVVGESYFTHGTFWDKDSPYLPDDPIGPPHDLEDGPQYELIQRYHDAGIPTIVVCLLPRPYVLTNVADLADALMVVYRPGDEGGTAIAQTLFGDALPQGKTPWQLPRSLEQIGIDDAGNYMEQPDKWDLPFDLGATEAEIAEILAAIAAGEPVSPTYGDPLFQYGAGIDGFGLADSTPPTAFTLLTPTNGVTYDGALPDFTWEASADEETGIQRYEVYVDDSLLATVYEENRYTLRGVALGNGSHEWIVRAYNWAGEVTASAASSFVIDDQSPPAGFDLLWPSAGAALDATGAITLYWEHSSDEGTGVARYLVEVDGAVQATVTPADPVPPTTNLALGRSASASSTSYGTPSASFDGDLDSRWSSAWDMAEPDLESLTVDLGAVYAIDAITIRWENAYGSEYLIQGSLDEVQWAELYHQVASAGGVHELQGIEGLARYLRVQGVRRALIYGYSIWEMEVYGAGTESLKLNLDPAQPHTWSVRAVDGAGNEIRNTDGSRALGTALSPLDAWRLAQFGTIDSADPQGGDSASPLGDGLPNLLKYALGIDPATPARMEDLPSIEIIDDHLALSFVRLKDATDIVYAVEAADELGGSWTEIWNSVGEPYEGGESPFELLSVEDVKSLSSSPGETRFLRLEVSVP
jgi:beta-glucosidase-like glycosyl hydrolase